MYDPVTDRVDGLACQLLKGDRKSTRLNSSHGYISYAVFCLKKKKNDIYAMLCDIVWLRVEFLYHVLFEVADPRFGRRIALRSTTVAEFTQLGGASRYVGVIL